MLKEKIFPRKLSKAEQSLLFSILPEEKSGYNEYRNMISSLYVIGEGRFGYGNLILGTINEIPDLSLSSSPVYALGTVISKSNRYEVIIHSSNEGMIEFQIDPFPIDEEIDIKNVITYSYWSPGMNSPENNSGVLQYEIKKDEYLLAISPLSKKIWLHDYKTGVNHIIPVSNFFNELMRLKNIRDDYILKTPSKFFEEVEKYSDLDIKLAFLMYNKYLKRFNLAGVLENTLEEKVNRKRHLKLFGRGLN